MTNNPQAFPVGLSADQHAYMEGMFLRDYMAGQALIGIMQDNQISPNPKAYATMCYEVADAMLQARQQKEDK